ncbi:hypothetical protein F4781DRAFT_433277 [Annulohypoxylon bovei var. microspora]|nr:hypothetical protein F4781DRAFT_433277 [Annulohypoxylon bovei var. microspora]
MFTLVTRFHVTGAFASASAFCISRLRSLSRKPRNKRGRDPFCGRGAALQASRPLPPFTRKSHALGQNEDSRTIIFVAQRPAFSELACKAMQIFSMVVPQAKSGWVSLGRRTAARKDWHWSLLSTTLSPNVYVSSFPPTWECGLGGSQISRTLGLESTKIMPQSYYEVMTDAERSGVETWTWLTWQPANTASGNSDISEEIRVRNLAKSVGTDAISARASTQRAGSVSSEVCRGARG